MRIKTTALLGLLLVPLVACASQKEADEAVDAGEASAAAAVREELPEVRYYVIADT